MMPWRHPLPTIWLISDARNDALLEAVLRRMPRGGGLIYRHYHLPPGERRARFCALARIAWARGIRVVLAGDMARARAWGADGAYGAAGVIGPGGPGLRLATVHSLRDIRRAGRADAVLLSPVYPTRSHPGGKVLGPLRFRLIAARSHVPVIALGGMDATRGRGLRWAAIDGLVPKSPSGG